MLLIKKLERNINKSIYSIIPEIKDNIKSISDENINLNKINTVYTNSSIFIKNKKFYIDSKILYLNNNRYLIIIENLIRSDNIDKLILYNTEKLANALIEMKKAKEDADKSNRLKTEFLSTISHELRTPLNKIIGYSEEFMKENLKDLVKSTSPKSWNSTCEQHSNSISENLSKYGSYINEAGKQLLNIINDMIDLSNIEAGKLSLNQVKFDIKPIIEEINKNYRNIAEKKNIELIIEIDENIENYWGDESRIYQILSNLVSNAIKFTYKGSVKISVEQIKNKILYSVSDTGIGIEAKDIKIIFEKFRQIDGSDKRKYGGTGMGLAICDNLVRMHSGIMWVESEINKGSTFYFYIDIPELN